MVQNGHRPFSLPPPGQAPAGSHGRPSGCGACDPDTRRSPPSLYSVVRTAEGTQVTIRTRHRPTELSGVTHKPVGWMSHLSLPQAPGPMATRLVTDGWPTRGKFETKQPRGDCCKGSGATNITRGVGLTMPSLMGQLSVTNLSRLPHWSSCGKG